MTYRIIYNETPVLRESVERWRGPAWSEEFADEHQALGRTRELIETGEHYSVAVDDGTGNVLSGVRLQWRLGGFSGE